MAWTATTRAAALSVLSNSLLVLAKLGIALAIGSVAVLAEALHSAMDLAAALIAFFSLRVAARPADREHPFGHGKVEAISGGIEALLIFAGAAIVALEAVRSLRTGSQLGVVEWGVGVMAVSAVANTLVSRHLLRVARREDSLALEADARHLTTDVYTSAGVFVGLGLVRVTGWDVLDPLAALAVAGLILRTAYRLTVKAFKDLMDTRLPEIEESSIRKSIEEHMGEMVGFHDLRTRKSGRERYIDLHLVVARHVSVEVAHGLADHLEADIQSKLAHSSVTIHIEPCTYQPGHCPARCHLARDGTCPALRAK
ncbi:MAG: cation transporter [Chloroflexi bacterium]|nr:cation transporter [Chloroflexota bacterium]